MKLKLFSVSRSDLNNVPIVSGQLLCTSDINGMYYDIDGSRYKQQPADDVLYNLISIDTKDDTVVIDYTRDTGSLGTGLDLTATEYKQLDFVFYDNGFNKQFTGSLYGLEYGNNGKFTYNWCPSFIASYNVDTTAILSSTSNIYRETIYVVVSVTADGTFTITSKTTLSESIVDGIVTMTETDISQSNRVALVKVIGRR